MFSSVKIRRMVEGQETSPQKENAKIITKPKTGSSSFPEDDASVDFDPKIWEAAKWSVRIQIGLPLMFKLSNSCFRNPVFRLGLFIGMPLLLSGQSGPAGILQPRYSQQTVTSGAEGKVQIELLVKEGFKVAKRPAPKLQVTPNAQFEVVVGGFS